MGFGNFHLIHTNSHEKIERPLSKGVFNWIFLKSALKIGIKIRGHFAGLLEP
jgi:hypothetical protein